MNQIDQLKAAFDACGIDYYESDCDENIEIGIRVGSNRDPMEPYPSKLKGNVDDYIPVFTFDVDSGEMIHYGVYV